MTGSLRDDQLERIVAAVESIEESLEILADKRTITREEYKRDRETQDIVERRFVKMTEAALAIAKVLLRIERGHLADSNAEMMRSLGEVGVVSGENADAMAAAARFRNVLAHLYGPVIDHETVYDAMHDLDRYRTFVREVRTYLDAIDAFKR